MPTIAVSVDGTSARVTITVAIPRSSFTGVPGSAREGGAKLWLGSSR